MASIVIGISEMGVVKESDSIITYALGSCVGVALYDRSRKIAGLAHILMPSSADIREMTNRAKYVDTAIPDLLKLMQRHGCTASSVTAKIAGGAQMFSMAGAGSQFNIGERNIKNSREVLASLNIRITAMDVGENYGRTVELFADSGIYRIKAIAKGVTEI